jgi:hypothetical protein
MRFKDLPFVELFDGIWACASLLHVPMSEVSEVLSLLTRALRKGGVLYLSFKWGESEAVRDGRLFVAHTPDTLRQLMLMQPELNILDIWATTDRRPGREEERWVNALVRRLK